MSLEISLTVNGAPGSATLDSATPLIEMLREKFGCKGVKLCCNTGECGACTVLMNGQPVNSCMMLAADAAGTQITTIEGVAGEDGLHPVQQAFIDAGAVQCGYCTPGFVLSVTALLDRTAQPTRAQVEEAVSGNICRCTGYTKIVDAISLAAGRMAEGR